MVARRTRRKGVVGWVEEVVRRRRPVRRDPIEMPREKGERRSPERVALGCGSRRCRIGRKNN